MGDTIIIIPERIREGIECFRKGQFEKSEAIFKNYLEAKPKTPIAISYLGLILAIHHHRIQEGKIMAEQALVLDKSEPVLYLNIARIYLCEGSRKDAVKCVERGLRFRNSPNWNELLTFHRRIGIRRHPVIPFLHRDNPLNLILGKLTFQLKRKSKMETFHY